MNLPAHFYMAPSSAARWIECPGSLHVCADLPDDAGDAANRGTLGHYLVEIDLAGESPDPAELVFLDTMSETEREELMEAVDLCIDLVSNLDGDFQLYETKIQSKVVECHGGTVDVIDYDSKTATLHVVDFKFGRVRVDIEDNRQIMCYLNLARQLFPDAKRFFGSIIQPAISDRMQTVEFTRARLEEHMTDVVEASVSKHFKAGDHCTFCPYLPQCETAAKHLRDEIKDFPDVTQLVANVDDRPTEEDVEKLCKIYKTFKLAEKATAGAGDILKRWASEGADVKAHGLGLRVSHRSYWGPNAEERLTEVVGDLDEVTETKVRTPKQVQEVLGMSKEEFNETFKDALDIRPVTALVLGRDSKEFPEFD